MGKIKIKTRVPKVAYSGSTIQQNYGESKEKGFLLWDIDNKLVNFVNVKNNYPFVTIDYAGSIHDLMQQVKNHSRTSRFRIKIDENVTYSETLQIKSAIKSIASPDEIVFKRESSEFNSNIDQDSLEDSVGIENFDSLKLLVEEFYKGSNIQKSTFDEMSNVLKEIWHTSNIEDASMSGKWSIKRLEFDNIFGYGEGNIVNLDSATGITGIFGKNRSGKSSICGAITYCLFNGTDRGPMKSMHIVNARKNFCRAKILLTKKGKFYLVDRMTVKKVNKKNEVNGITNLNFFECNEKGEQIKDLSDEQRRETEKVLRDHIGNLEDFLLTSFSSQEDVNRFIKLGSSSRKTILAKFLRLDVLDTLHEVVKQRLSSLRTDSVRVSSKEFDSHISEKEALLKATNNSRDEENQKIEKLDNIFSLIQNELNRLTTNVSFTKQDINEQTVKISSISNSIESLDIQQTILSKKIDTLNKDCDQLSAESQKIDIVELMSKKKQFDEQEKDLYIAKTNIESKKSAFKISQNEVKTLLDVPCGDSFPSCKYIINAKTAQTSLNQKQNEIESLNTKIETLTKQLSNVTKSNIEHLINEKQTFEKRLTAIKDEKHRCDVKFEMQSGKLEKLITEMSHEEIKLNEMKKNVCDDESTQKRWTLSEKLKDAQKKIATCKLSVQKMSEKIGILNAELNQIKKDKAIYEKNNQKTQVLTHLQKALCRDGIPLQIIKKNLPIINNEISNILQGVVGYTVELICDANDGLEIMLNYGDSKRIIECCSGMEKMMASLAIRTSLTRVSSLPKSDLLIIDEGFGSLDGTNIEACTSLLRSLTKTFKTILIISHVDTVKDVVDNIIEISAEKSHDSRVEYL